jgi:hypothetical protein
MISMRFMLVLRFVGQLKPFSERYESPEKFTGILPPLLLGCSAVQLVCCKIWIITTWT